MNSQVQQARQQHRAAEEAERSAAQHRLVRDELIRRAYAGGGHSYASLARAIGCSPELVAKIVQGRTSR